MVQQTHLKICNEKPTTEVLGQAGQLPTTQGLKERTTIISLLNEHCLQHLPP